MNLRQAKEINAQQTVEYLVNGGQVVGCLVGPKFDGRDLFFYMLYDIDGIPIGSFDFSNLRKSEKNPRLAHYFEKGGAARAHIKYKIYIREYK